MNKWPIIFGYAGTIPFILLMFVSLFIDDEKGAHFTTVLQLSYAVLTLSFLGGIHWGQAVAAGNMRQLTFAMLPTVLSILLLISQLWFGAAIPLLGAAGLFYAVYKADRRFMPVGYVPEKYFDFRRKLTIIVCSALVVSFVGVIL